MRKSDRKDHPKKRAQLSNSMMSLESGMGSESLTGNTPPLPHTLKIGQITDISTTASVITMPLELEDSEISDDVKEKEEQIWYLSEKKERRYRQWRQK